jgi:hypothetical protein
VSRGQRGGSLTVVNLSFLDRQRPHTLMKIVLLSKVFIGKSKSQIS